MSDLIKVATALIVSYVLSRIIHYRRGLAVSRSRRGRRPNGGFTNIFNTIDSPKPRRVPMRLHSYVSFWCATPNNKAKPWGVVDMAMALIW